MKKFVLIYYGKVRPEDISKEEMKSTMDKINKINEFHFSQFRKMLQDFL